jgi:hypothetical protein
MRYLVDNDVFFAAIYTGHTGHAIARRGLDAAKPEGWGIAAETYLAAVRLLMNHAITGEGALTAGEALDAVAAELAGPHPGRIVLAREAPDRALLTTARGHRQIMDFGLVQLARQEGARLVTHDEGTLTNWPADTLRPPV